ncbi:DUF1353 domain-containing protein [Pseudomonas sp. FJ2-5-13]|uniref:DUF1353 domain-containing protein n=1 Tax=Pseudomonas TaxID=286 RepID=UPI001648860A|nr:MULTISPECIES: DUF1353 domain-containing protein [Pseudomonas]QXH79305.1 DUF1353 domain-containing protein [Pseudomonas salmasensis]WEJ03862.1 DUF1353 domain-containing protein [Pseudomonas sp. FJ2-5-13]
MKLPTLFFLVLALVGCSARTSITPVVPFPAHDFWILLKDKTYDIGSSGAQVIIPAGFVTDYASIPKSLWSIASPHSDYSEAATIHDYLYWTQSCTRLQADNIFLIAMKEDGVSDFRRWTIYRAVRGAGQGSWNDNAEAVSLGMPRWVPEKQRELTKKSNWPLMQKQLADDGVRDPILAKNQPYCEFGNNTEVPSEVKKEIAAR